VDSRSLSLIGGGILLGVFAESIFKFGVAFGAALILIAAALFIFERAQNRLLLLSLFFLAAGLGVFRMGLSELSELPLAELEGRKIIVEGIVVSEPDMRETKTFLTVKLSLAGAPDSVVAAPNIKIILKVSQFHSFSYGDKVRAEGILERPTSFETDGGGTFDYPSYLAKDGIYFVIDDPKIELLGRGGGNPLRASLYFIKGKFLESLSKNISEPESSLLGGLVVGGKHTLGEKWLEKFQRAGVMHIVVLSGYNITIVANSVIKLFGLVLPRVLSMSLGAVAIILFALMTGGSATVVRAALMAMIVILSRYTKRNYDVTRALIVAGVIMVFENPWIVAFDPSFQLSFMATLSLIYVSPVMSLYLKFLPERFGFREIFVSTISTQVFVLPLLLSMNGIFSVVALPVNLLILGVIPFTMFVGFFAGIVGIVSLTLALPFAAMSFLLLSYILKVVDVFSSLPFSVIQMPSLSGLEVAVIYAFMITFLMYWHVNISNKKKTTS
jgi:competence protein ComEC